MIHYNEFDLASYDEWVKILEYLGGEEPDEDDVWEIAKGYDKVPIFENILLYVLFNRLAYAIQEKYDVEVNYFINAADSHLYINGEGCYDLETFKELTNETV